MDTPRISAFRWPSAAPSLLWLPGLALFLSIGVSSLASTQARADADGRWSQNTFQPDQPAGSYGIASTYDPVRHRMIFYGGSGVGIDGVWALELGPPRHWSRIITTGTPPLLGESATAVYDSDRDRVLFFGGSASDGRVYALDLTNASWSVIEVAGASPVNRRYHCATYDPATRSMVIYGGQSFQQSDNVMGEAWRLSLDAPIEWTPIAVPDAPDGPGKRRGPSAALDPVRHRMLVFGGGYQPDFADVWALDLSTIAWSRIDQGAGPTPRERGTAAYDATGDRLVIAGGTISLTGGAVGDVWALDLAGTHTWTQLAPDPPPSQKHMELDMAIDPVAGDVVTYGGAGEVNGYSWVVDRVMSLSFATGAWSESMLEHVPPPLHGAAGAFDPAARRLIVADVAGASLHPPVAFTLGTEGTQAWRRLIPQGSASLPSECASAWDPVHGRLWFFGGLYRFGYLNNHLYSLDPGTSPAWPSQGITGFTPSARMNAQLVDDALRDRLILFGGHTSTSSGVLADLYEIRLSGPNAYQWMPLAASGTAPPPRSGGSMIYDAARDRVILFGGRGSLTLSDVWSLELGGGTPAWVQLSPSGTAPPRYLHGAVLDAARDRMIVFGGQDASQAPTNDAWQLTLGANPEWRPLAPAGTPPPARADFVIGFDRAADRAVIFGGDDGNAATGDFADTWVLDFSDPVAAGAPRVGTALAITTLAPNPAHDGFELAFQVVRRGAVDVELVDVTGRRVAARHLAAAEPGAHRIALGFGRGPAGIYFVRLRQGGAVVASRVVRID